MAVLSRRGALPLLLVPGLGILAGCGGGAAGTQAALPEVALFQIASTPVLDEGREGFVKSLADAGFIDGKTVRLTRKDAQGDPSTAQMIAQDLAARKVEVIAAFSTPAFQAAMKATDQVPIVFAVVANPYAAGAGESAEKHRPNVGGSYAPINMDSAVDLAREILPSAEVIGGLFDPGEAFSEPYVKAAEKKCAALGLRWVGVAVNGTTEVVSGVQALQSRGVEIIVQPPGNTVYAALDGEIRQAKALKIPVVGINASAVKSGAVAGIGADMFDWGYNSGKVAVRILKGESPAGIPFQEGSKEKLAVNPDAARALGLQLPASVLKRAAPEKSSDEKPREPGG